MLGQDPIETVKQWFKRARLTKFGISINLYYAPNGDAWTKLATPVIYKGVNTGLWEFERAIYKIVYGPADCEETLHFVGEIKEET